MDFSFEQETGPVEPEFGFDQSDYAHHMDVIEEEPAPREFDKSKITPQKSAFEEAVLFEPETSEEPTPPLPVPLSQLFRPSTEPSPTDIDRSKWSSRTNIVLKALERKLENKVHYFLIPYNLPRTMSHLKICQKIFRGELRLRVFLKFCSSRLGELFKPPKRNL